MQYINNFLTRSINSNNQCDKIIQSIAELNSQRVISILLPFFSLHSKNSLARGTHRTHLSTLPLDGEAASKPTYDKSIDTLKLAGSITNYLLPFRTIAVFKHCFLSRAGPKIQRRRKLG